MIQTQLEDIPVRNVNLPSFEVSTLLVPREKELLPLISLDLSINKIDLHLSTEILNQLLVVQSSFVKVCIAENLTRISLTFNSVFYCMPLKRNREQVASAFLSACPAMAFLYLATTVFGSLTLASSLYPS